MKSDMPAGPVRGLPLPAEAQGVVDSYGRAFPGGAASWYLTGSHADGSAIDLSDVDLLCIADPLHTDLYNWARTAQAPYSSKVDILMLHPSSLNTVLNANAIPMLQSARLIAGRDVRDQLPPLDLRAYQETVGYKFGRDVAHFHPTGAVDGPPSPHQEFLGFVGPAKAWTGMDNWTHDVVVLVGKAATAIGATRGLVAGTRREALLQMSQIREFGEWSLFCTDTVVRLRDEWHYRVPPNPGDRLFLRSICERLCDLENVTLDALEQAGIDPYRDSRLNRHRTRSPSQE
jgi:hypothetical protein